LFHWKKKHFYNFSFSFLLIISANQAFAQERCSDLDWLRYYQQSELGYKIIDQQELKNQVLSRWQRTGRVISVELQQTLSQRLNLVEQALLPEGPLDQFFKENNLDSRTAIIYLYGTTASLVSKNPLKKNHSWSTESDIDFIISVRGLNGEYWRLSRGPHKPSSIQNVPIEVQSLYLMKELDVVLYNEFGMEVFLPEETQAIPDYAILVRQPK
jgi:hypothetical protein